MAYCDLHTHVIPGVDDGPGSLEQALDGLSFLSKTGFDTVVATPHDGGVRQVGAGVAAEAFKALSEHSAVKSMGIRLETGCEYMFGSDVIDDHGAGRIRMLGGQAKYFLLEFATLALSGFHKNFFFQVFLSGRVPVLAHPERCDLRSPSAGSMFEYLVQNGSPVQCDLASLSGRWGRAAADNAWRLIDSGTVSAFSTDTHCRENEREELVKAIGLLESHAGREKTLGYLDANPRRILAGLRPVEGSR